MDVESAPLAGSFAVTSRFEVPATVAAPGPLGDTLRLLHGLAVDPGTALLDYAEEAGVPALAELRLVLPDALEAELVDWMNAYLETAVVDGVSPYQQIVELDGLVRSVLLSWELRSTLSLPVDGPGTHAPVALAFDGPSGPVVVPVDATAPVTSGVDVTATLTWPDGSAGPARVTIGEHAMGIPFGRYAASALDAILLARTGAGSVEAFLSAAVRCDDLAASVAARCLGPICVGHEAELREICQGGVAEAAARIEAQVLGLDFDVVHFEQGVADAPGVPPAALPDVSLLQNGVWTAAIDLGNGAETATATFVAARRGSRPCEPPSSPRPPWPWPWPPAAPPPTRRPADEAYGNATTDVHAYAGAGIPAGATWIIGPNGGSGGTHAVTGSWQPRAEAVAAEPPVEQPFAAAP